MNSNLHEDIWDACYTGGKKLPWGDLPELLENEQRFVAKFIRPDMKRALDYGFGPGDMARWLMRQMPNAEIVGAEISQNAIDLAASAPFKKIKVQTPVDCKPFGSFDLIASIGVLHHVAPDLQARFMREFRELMADNSVLIVIGWDESDAYFKGKENSLITGNPIFAQNHLLDDSTGWGYRVVETETFQFFDDVKYNMNRVMRCIAFAKE